MMTIVVIPIFENKNCDGVLVRVCSMMALSHRRQKADNHNWCVLCIWYGVLGDVIKYANNSMALLRLQTRSGYCDVVAA